MESFSQFMNLNTLEPCAGYEKWSVGTDGNRQWTST